MTRMCLEGRWRVSMGEELESLMAKSPESKRADLIEIA